MCSVQIDKTTAARLVETDQVRIMIIELPEEGINYICDLKLPLFLTFSVFGGGR